MKAKSVSQFTTHFFVAISLSLALFFSGPQASATPVNAARVSTPNLSVLYDSVIGELRRGGTVVYFVPFHTQGTDQTDQPGWWKECAISRMVSEHGLEQASAVKRAILQLNLNIQFVESSEACTALSTQTFLVSNRWLRFFITPDLNPVAVLRQAGLKDDVIKALVLGHFQTVIVDSVKLLFGFPMPLSTAPHPVLADLTEGESAVFRISETDEPVLLARLNWRQWQEMGNYFELTQAALNRAPKKKRS